MRCAQLPAVLLQIDVPVAPVRGTTFDEAETIGAVASRVKKNNCRFGNDAALGKVTVSDAADTLIIAVSEG